MSSTPLVGLLLAALSFAWLAGCSTPAGVTPAVAAIHARTNTDLIGSMPAATESVLVADVRALGAKGSVLPLVPMFFEPEQNLEPGTFEIREVALAAARSARTSLCASGGSGFSAPRGLGMGHYTERMILCTEGSLEPLRKQLAAGTGVRNFVGSADHAGVAVYHGRSTTELDDGDRRSKAAPSDRYVAVPDDHTLVIAPTEGEAEEMIKLLAAPAHSVPQKWIAAARELSLDSSLVVLRRYDPTNDKDYMSPVNPQAHGDKRANIDSIALVLPSDRERKLLVHAVTGDADDARRFLQRNILLNLKWVDMPAPDGVKAELSFDEQNDIVSLQVLTMFGPNLAI